MFAFLAFQLGLFLEVVVIYPSTFCVTPSGSLFWRCVLLPLELMWDFYIYSILPRTLPRPASHQAEENAFFNCFAVVSCYLHLIAPGFYTRRSGQQVSVPLLQATQCHSPLVAIVLHTPKISPFFLVWTVTTCSVIQYKDCSASAVIHITFFEVFPALLSLYHCLYFSFCKDEGIRTTPQE